jgi:hypothetical protein
MRHLFLLALSLLVFPPENQKPPAAFYEIPEQIRERATVVFSGTYSEGRTPCIWRPDGTRVWGLDSSFLVKTVYRGKVHSRVIRINKSMLPESGYVTKQLESQRKYLVLLQPRVEKMKAIKTKEGLGFWDSLRGEEIVAIVQMR